MAKTFHTLNHGSLRLGRKIGAGGEGAVYEVQTRDDLVAKLYFEAPSEEKADKLFALAARGTERLLTLTAWPVEVLRDAPGGRVVGFLMNRVSQAEEVHTLHSPKSRLQKFPDASWAFLLYVAANIARAVAAVHEHDIVVGDLNPKNILVTRKATVCLLDCDSFQLKADGRTFRCEAGFPEYTPPELQGLPFKDLDRLPAHDHFGLGIVIFQLLFVGRHPFSGRFRGAGEMPLERAIREFRFAYGDAAARRQMQPPPGTLPFDAIPPAIADLFRRAFLSTTPADRPLAREWVEPLESLARALRRCDLHSGHYYFAELAACPWCAIETRAHVRLFNFALAGADGQRPAFRLDEIWREIESLQMPVAVLEPRQFVREIVVPSPEVRAHNGQRLLRLRIAIGFSVIAGFAIGWGTDLSVFLVFMALAVAQQIANAELLPSQVLTLFQPTQPAPDNPLAERNYQRKLEAERAVGELEARLAKEAGAGRFEAKLDELRMQRNAYTGLPQTRARMLRQLAAETRQEQLADYLSQAQIETAEISSIWFSRQSELASRGIRTAADVTPEKLRQVPDLGDFTAARLLDWRRDLERRFEPDPAAGSTPEARIAVERKMDAMRRRLEGELQSGPFYLRRIKEEIEAKQTTLQPALAEAAGELAQAETDYEVASKRNSLKTIIFVLIAAFLMGTLFKELHSPNGPEHPPVRPRVQSAAPDAPSESDLAKAREQTYLGREYLKAAQYENALASFEKAISLDLESDEARNGYISALYNLGRHQESIESAHEILARKNAFHPYYYLGLNYIALGEWSTARIDFQMAINYCDVNAWDDAYSDAFYQLGRTLTHLGETNVWIRDWEKELARNPIAPLTRFQLVDLYLWAGDSKAAKRHYRVLKSQNPKLAKELLKLMRRHGLPFRDNS
jgi:DNA-binding helix-hairpin-helix protein with protein kinase domain